MLQKCKRVIECTYVRREETPSPGTNCIALMIDEHQRLNSVFYGRAHSDPKDGIALHEYTLVKHLIHKFANNHAANIRSSPYQDAIDSHLKGHLKLIEA